MSTRNEIWHGLWWDGPNIIDTVIVLRELGWNGWACGWNDGR